MKITALRARDVRFPTSREMDGSDALNVGDYSAVYVMLETDGPHAGYGLTFTNGRGTEIGVAAARAFEPPGGRPRRSRRSPPTSAASTTGSPRTRSCAGSAPRRASSTWRPARW